MAEVEEKHDRAIAIEGWISDVSYDSILELLHSKWHPQSFQIMNRDELLQAIQKLMPRSGPFYQPWMTAAMQQCAAKYDKILRISLVGMNAMVYKCGRMAGCRPKVFISVVYMTPTDVVHVDKHVFDIEGHIEVVESLHHIATKAEFPSVRLAASPEMALSANNLLWFSQ